MVVGGLEEGFACPSPTRGLRTVVYGFRFPMVGAGLEGGCWMVGEMVVQCLNCPKVGRMSVRGRRKGALPCLEFTHFLTVKVHLTPVNKV